MRRYDDFAGAMSAMGLDPAYGAYLDRLPARTLATVNLMSLFGLNRRLRGAIVGHLALFEMTSSLPNARYARGIRRLGYSDPAATDFFDEHVEADAVHEAIAATDLAGALADDEPALTPAIRCTVIAWNPGYEKMISAKLRAAGSPFIAASRSSRSSRRNTGSRRRKRSTAVSAPFPSPVAGVPSGASKPAARTTCS